jgi:molybdopterin converting factor subunit 1
MFTRASVGSERGAAPRAGKPDKPRPRPARSAYARRGLVRVRLLYFAALKDLAGLTEEWLELGDVASVSDVVARLTELRPAFAGRLDSVRVAVNEAFAAPSDRVREGDTLALIPPVSGG